MGQAQGRQQVNVSDVVPMNSLHGVDSKQAAASRKESLAAAGRGRLPSTVPPVLPGAGSHCGKSPMLSSMQARRRRGSLGSASEADEQAMGSLLGNSSGAGLERVGGLEGVASRKRRRSGGRSRQDSMDSDSGLGGSGLPMSRGRASSRDFGTPSDLKRRRKTSSIDLFSSASADRGGAGAGGEDGLLGRGHPSHSNVQQDSSASRGQPNGLHSGGGGGSGK